MECGILTILEIIKSNAEFFTAIGTLALALVTFVYLYENRRSFKEYIRQAERDRKYEIKKKQAYFELLEIILEANRFFGYVRDGEILDDKF